MHRSALFLLALATAAALAADNDPVFRSDVSLVRVDAQVVDRDNRAITGLELSDFVLKESGRAQEIRNFEREEMPVDVILLLDVSGSMRSHVERIAQASNRALRQLAEGDRVAIMVFDRSTRIRLPFRGSHEDVERALYGVINQETFDGGTDITRALYDAASYMRKESRPGARHAIVILTDDQTERGRDESGVGRALAQSDTVLSALLAPDAMHSGRVSIGGGGWPGGSRGGGWPGGGMGGPLGGIILGGGGRRFPGGGRYPTGPSVSMPRTQSAGTAQIATHSGGDSMRVDESSAFETTLARIRQRYALHFNLPEGVKPGEERDITVELSAAARRRYPDAEVRFRRMNQAGITNDGPVVVSSDRTNGRRSETESPADPDATPEPAQRPEETRRGGWRRVDDPHSDRPADGGPLTTARTPERTTPAPPAADSRPAASSPQPQPEEAPKQSGGWRRISPGEKP